MRVALYIHCAGGSGGFGGGEDMCIDLVKASDRSIVDFIFVTESSVGWTVTLDEMISMNVPVFQVDGDVPSFQQVYRKECVDLVQVYSCGDIQNGYKAALELGIKVLDIPACVSYSTGWEQYPNLVTAAYLCRSHWESVGSRSYFLRVDGGVDLHRLDDAADKIACKNHWGLDTSRPVVGWYGRFDCFKCPLSFPDIARFVKEKVNAQFIMFGDGPDRGHTEGLARQANVDIKFTGMVRQKGLAFGAMDIYAFPSWQEAFGRVMVEAMASGVPIVTSDYPVMHEVCDNAAFYVENARQDPLPIMVSKKYADEIIKLIQQPNSLKAMSQIGIERAKLYDAKRMAREYTELYFSMIK